MTFAAAILLLLATAFGAAQGTVVAPSQKYWLIGTWFVCLPAAIAAMVLLGFT